MNETKIMLRDIVTKELIHHSGMKIKRYLMNRVSNVISFSYGRIFIMETTGKNHINK